MGVVETHTKRVNETPKIEKKHTKAENSKYNSWNDYLSFFDLLIFHIEIDTKTSIEHLKILMVYFFQIWNNWRNIIKNLFNDYSFISYRL